MVKTKLGWKKAKEVALDMIKSGGLTRDLHLATFEKFMESKNDPDQMIAVALLKYYIENYPDDFDNEITLEKLIAYGKKIARETWAVFGREVMYPVIATRSIPAVWIDRIADEEPSHVKLAFCAALEKMASAKRISLDRILGFAQYFIDDPDSDVREQLIGVFTQIANRDAERLHYFFNEFESGAGSSRRALIHDARVELDMENFKGIKKIN